MKLATLKDGSRDGLLAVVSRDLTQAHFAAGIASRMQQLLDDWNFISPQLEDLYATLNGGKARHAFAFDPRHCMAPLPRAYQWAEASAYPTHARRLRGASGTDPAAQEADAPRLEQGSGDHFLGPCDDAVFAEASSRIDFGAGLAVITGDVPMGATPEAALDGVRLLMLVNGWRLRGKEPAGGTESGGAAQNRPAPAFSPVAVTPDELGGAWRGGRVHLEIESVWNGQRLGRCSAGESMGAHFGELIAQLAAAREVRAGSIVGSGTVSHADSALGCHCAAEKAALDAPAAQEARGEVVRSATWPGLGDLIRIEMLCADGTSLYGAIEQRLRAR